MMDDVDEEKRNRQLLYNAIFRTFTASGLNAEEAAAATERMIFDHIDNLFGLHGLAYQIGEIDIQFFCKYFLQDTFIPKPDNAARELAPVHYEIWNELDKMFLQDLFDKLELVLPRGIAKTTVCNFALSVWLHCYKKSIFTLVAGRTEQDSVEFISQIRQAFEENQYILEAFGKLLDPNKGVVNKLELEFTNKTKIQAISSTSSMRGKKYNGARPSVIIADDYQSKADVITQEARDKKFKTWTEDSGYAGDKAVYRNGKKIKQATKFIVLGTILHRDCFMSRLLKQKDYMHILKRVVNFDVDEYFHSGLWEQFRVIYFNDKLQDPESAAKEFYFQHEKEMQYSTIWPDKFDCLDTAIDYYTNSEAFKQEAMNDASHIGDKWFKSNRVESAEEIENHNFEKTMLCADPASTANRKSDSFAFLVGSLADNEFKYVRKAELKKFDARTEFDKYIDHIIDLLIQYTDVTHVYIEKNTFNGADANRLEQRIKEEPLLKGRDLTIINEAQKSNKDDKIATVTADVNNGRIIFNAEDQDFIDEVMEFAGQGFTLHDDAPDILAEFSKRISDIEVLGTIEFIDKSRLF